MSELSSVPDRVSDRGWLARWRAGWRTLVLTDLLFKAIAFTLLTPCAGLLLSGFLALTGRGVLTDLELARVLRHPAGWAAVVVLGTAMLAIAALQQSALIAVSICRSQGRPLSAIGSLRFIAGKAAGVLRLAGRMVLRLIVLTLPFVAAAGGLYVWLLGDHDINYYLDARPPRFYQASAAIGAVLLAGAALVATQVAGWAVALPLLLFEGTTPRESLSESLARTRGVRGKIAAWIGLWFLFNAVISAAATGLLLPLGARLVTASVGRLWVLIPVLGGVLGLWTLLNLATSLLAATTFAMLPAEAYDRWGKSARFSLPDWIAGPGSLSPQWSRGRIGACVVLGVLAAAVIGATTVQSLPVADSAEVSAHRGGAGTAPENSLAAVRQAIAHGTDWIEIDVQESRDGEVLVVHDADLQKLARFAGKIWETTAADLRRVDIGSSTGPQFAGERVPTLGEVLDACRGRARVLIELKYYGHDQRLEERVIELVEARDMADEVAVMSMNPRGIAKVRKLRPTWRVGLTTAVAAGDLTRVDADFLAVNSRLATEPFVQLAHSRGQQVFVWTINDPLAMTTLLSRGVDNLITDYPEVARSVLNERAELSPGERLLLELAVLFHSPRSSAAP